MFRLYSHSKEINPHTLTTSLYDDRSFYQMFWKDLKHAQNDVLIESPYLTVKRASEFAGIFKKLKKRHVRVRINTREPRHHTPRLRQQAEDAIRILKRVGVKVYVCNDLRHRKLAVIDNEILWEGSLNILSQSRSRELMRRTESPEQCRLVINFTGITRKFW